MEQLYVSFCLGYGSFDYEEAGYEETLVVKVDILLNDEPVPELSTITHSSKVRRFYKSDIYWCGPSMKFKVIDTPDGQISSWKVSDRYPKRY